MEDSTTYLEWLHDASTKHDVAVPAYVLMANHVHLLVSPKSEQALPKTVRDVNWRYSRCAKAAHNRSGSFWDGRYKACIVDSTDYFLTCSHYIELNPVRAGIAQDPAAYRWSSYKADAEGVANPLLTPHPLYTGPDTSAEGRAAAYRDFFRDELSESRVEAIRTATNGGWELGRESFAIGIGRHAGCNMVPRGLGRPWLKKA